MKILRNASQYSIFLTEIQNKTSNSICLFYDNSQAGQIHDANKQKYKNKCFNFSQLIYKEQGCYFIKISKKKQKKKRLYIHSKREYKSAQDATYQCKFSRETLKIVLIISFYQNFKSILEILQKAPLKRTPRDIHFLQNETKNIQFFKQYIENGDQDNTTGTKFYLILEGTVGVYIRLPKKKQENEDNTSGSHQEIDSDLVCVKELTAGIGFGELALMNNKPRLASIICHSNCHFATLDKKEFTDILKEKEEEKLIKEMGFFASLPFFKGWNFNLVKMLYLNSVRVNFVKGDRIYKEGSEPLAVYIIVSGEFVLEKSFQKSDECDHLYKTSSQQVRHLMGSNKKATKQFQISVYTNPELFGDEEIMEGLEYRKCTAICNSAQGQCILIKKRDFEIRIMHEEGALSYLQERLAIKNQRMKEKIEAIGKQIDNFKNFIYDDPKDFKRQIDFKKIYRTQQGRQSLDLVTLSELKEMIQTGQNPSKKKKKIKDSQQPDINLYEEGLIKSQNEIVLPKEEDEYYINSPKRSQSPEKNEKKPQENILQEHFMELLHQHIHKQKKKEQKNVMAQTQYNTQKSQGDQSQLQQLTTHQQLQNQQTLQKFSSFSKEGQDYSPTLHSMNKSQILSSNQKSSNKPNQPSVSMMNLSTNDFSPQITNAKFQKLRLQQSLIQPPNIVKLYDNPYGEEEKKGNKRQLLSSIYFNKNTNQSRQQLPSDSGKRSTMNTYNIFSQSQTEFPQFSNSKQVVTDIEVNRKDLKQRYQKKGKSLSQINLSQQNIAVNNIPKEDSYQIKIQSEDGNNNSNNNIINNNIIYSTEQTNHNDFKNEIVPLLLSPPTLHTNIDKQKRILAYTKQNTPDKFITGTQTFYLPEDKSEAVISSQIYQDSSQQLYRKSSSGNILIMSPAQGVPSEQFLINPKNMNDSEQITCTYSINTLTNYNNTQNNLPPMSSSSSQQKQQPSQQKEKGMSYRSISAIIQNSIKNIDPLSRDSIIRSSGRLNESVRLQHQIQISSSPAKGLGRQYVSFSKSPSKLQPYKFQKEYQAASNKQKDKNDDRFFQLSKQKVRIYEAIHQNPKTIKFIKDSLKEHHQSSMNNSSAPIKSPKQKLLPIKVRQSLLPQSLQNSPLISRQSEINTAHSELSSPVHTQKHSLLLKNIARKSEYSLQANESNINNPQRNNNFLPN